METAGLRHVRCNTGRERGVPPWRPNGEDRNHFRQRLRKLGADAAGEDRRATGRCAWGDVLPDKRNGNKTGRDRAEQEQRGEDRIQAKARGNGGREGKTKATATATAAPRWRDVMAHGRLHAAGRRAGSTALEDANAGRAEGREVEERGTRNENELMLRVQRAANRKQVGVPKRRPVPVMRACLPSPSMQCAPIDSSFV